MRHIVSFKYGFEDRMGVRGGRGEGRGEATPPEKLFDFLIKITRFYAAILEI